MNKASRNLFVTRSTFILLVYLFSPLSAFAQSMGEFRSGLIIPDPTIAGTISPGSTATSTPTVTITPAVTVTAQFTISPTPSATISATITPTPSVTNTALSTVTATTTPSLTPSPTPTRQRQISLYPESNASKAIDLGAPGCNKNPKNPKVETSLYATARLFEHGFWRLAAGEKIKFRTEIAEDAENIEFVTPTEVLTNSRGQASVVIKSNYKDCDVGRVFRIGAYWGSEDEPEISDTNSISASYHIRNEELKVDISPRAYPLPSSRSTRWWYNPFNARGGAIVDTVRAAFHDWEILNPRAQLPIFQFAQILSPDSARIKIYEFCDINDKAYATTGDWVMSGDIVISVGIALNIPKIDGDPRASVSPACRSDFPGLNNLEGLSKRKNFNAIMAHEIGHAAYLTHAPDEITNRWSLMYKNPSSQSVWGISGPQGDETKGDLFNIFIDYPTDER